MSGLMNVQIVEDHCQAGNLTSHCSHPQKAAALVMGLERFLVQMVSLFAASVGAAHVRR